MFIIGHGVPPCLQIKGLQGQVLHGFTSHTTCVAAMGNADGNKNIFNVYIGE